MSKHRMDGDAGLEQLNDTAFAYALEPRFSHPNGTRVWRFTRRDPNNNDALYVPIDMEPLHGES